MKIEWEGGKMKESFVCCLSEFSRKAYNVITLKLYWIIPLLTSCPSLSKFNKSQRDDWREVPKIVTTRLPFERDWSVIVDLFIKVKQDDSPDSKSKTKKMSSICGCGWKSIFHMCFVICHSFLIWILSF